MKRRTCNCLERCLAKTHEEGNSYVPLCYDCQMAIALAGQKDDRIEKVCLVATIIIVVAAVGVVIWLI